MTDEFEQSITKKYRDKLWSKFVKAIKEYQLIQPMIMYVFVFLVEKTLCLWQDFSCN